MSIEFLQAVLGKNGAEAFLPLLQEDPAIENFLIPRTAIAWLSDLKDWSGNLPGTQIPFKFQLDNQFYNGSIGAEDSLYSFTQASLEHTAATISVYLEYTPVKSSQPDVNLARLGRTVDALVRFTRKAPPPLPFVRQKPLILTEYQLSRDEGEKLCPTCLGKQIHEEKYVGCYCLKGLENKVEMTAKEDGWALILQGWDNDAINTLTYSIGRG